jgi:hypothetical protein
MRAFRINLAIKLMFLALRIAPSNVGKWVVDALLMGLREKEKKRILKALIFNHTKP